MPVRLEDIQPTGAFLYELASRNWINAFEEIEATLRNLAASLAAMVKSGDIHPAALPFDRPESKPLWLRPKAMLTTAGVVACAALLAAGIALTQTLDQKPAKERIALFGIDAPANDNDAVTAAADTSIRSSFATLQRDVAASADTEGTPVRDRTARALQLHATYAITGSATLTWR